MNELPELDEFRPGAIPVHISAICYACWKIKKKYYSTVQNYNDRGTWMHGGACHHFAQSRSHKLFF